MQTTPAFTVVGGAAGAPLGILSNSVLVPAGHQRGRAFEMGHDRGTIAACRAADRFAWPRGAGGRRRTSALARAGSARALVAFGETLFDLDVSDPSHPVVTSALDLERPLVALRTDALDARAYGVASDDRDDRDDQGWRHHGRRDRDDRDDQGWRHHGRRDRDDRGDRGDDRADARPVFDLSGGALERTGAHRISFWVTRRDKGSVRLRVTRRGVDVAEVAP